MHNLARPPHCDATLDDMRGQGLIGVMDPHRIGNGMALIVDVPTTVSPVGS